MSFWLEKFEKNIARDARVTAQLEATGWKVLVVWECELASKEKSQAAGKRLQALIRDAPLDAG